MVTMSGLEQQRSADEKVNGWRGDVLGIGGVSGMGPHRPRPEQTALEIISMA